MYSLVHLAQKIISTMFGNTHGAFRSLDLDRDTDEWACFTLLVAPTDSWCMGRC